MQTQQKLVYPTNSYPPFVALQHERQRSKTVSSFKLARSL